MLTSSTLCFQGKINGYYNGVAQSLIASKSLANGRLNESDEYMGSNSNSSTPLLSGDKLFYLH